MIEVNKNSLASALPALGKLICRTSPMTLFKSIKIESTDGKLRLIHDFHLLPRPILNSSQGTDRLTQVSMQKRIGTQPTGETMKKKIITLADPGVRVAFLQATIDGKTM